MNASGRPRLQFPAGKAKPALSNLFVCDVGVHHVASFRNIDNVVKLNFISLKAKSVDDGLKQLYTPREKYLRSKKIFFRDDYQ